MFELTSAPYRFRNALADGDLYQALGLTSNASSLDIDVAGARLAERAPGMAQEVSKVVNVLSHRQRRMVYDAVRQLCDDVMATLAARHGAEFGNSFPDYRRDLWQRCCRLFRFDLSRGGTAIGPRGVESLVRNGPTWIRHEFLAARVPGKCPETSAPKGLLDRFFQLQEDGQDVTIEEVKSRWEREQAAARKPVVAQRPSVWTRDISGSLAGVGAVLFLVAMIVATAVKSDRDRPSTLPRQTTRPWTPEPFRWTPEPFQVPTMPANSSYESISKMVERMQQQKRKEQIEKWLRRGGERDPAITDQILKELERQKAKHGCAGHPCAGFQKLQAAIDAIHRGKPVIGWIEDDKLHIEVVPAFAYEDDSPLGRWLHEAGTPDAVPSDMIKKELEHQKEKHDCQDNPCSDMRRLLGVIEAIDRGDAVTGHIEQDQLHIDLGARTSPAPKPSQGASSDVADGEADRP